MENQEMKAWMQKQEAVSRKQLRYSKTQCILTGVAAVCCLVMLVAVLAVAACAVPLLSQAAPVMEQLQTLGIQAGDALENLDSATEKLAQIDLTNITDKLDTLVTSSQSAVEEALEKINTIDITTLNQAIADLARVVEPLARITNVFG